MTSLTRKEPDELQVQTQALLVKIWCDSMNRRKSASRPATSRFSLLSDEQSRLLGLNPESLSKPKSWPDQEPENPLDRAQKEKVRQEHCQGLDLVAKALQDPKSLNTVQREALLGRPVYNWDATAFLRLLRGYSHWQISSFKRGAAAFDRFVHYSPELCKFTICDWRVPQDFGQENGDANDAIESLYQEQLRLEEEQSPLEKARNAVRDKWDQCARFYARRVLREYEIAGERREAPDPYQIWVKFKPMMPPWVWRIRQSKEDYGFIIYRSRETEQRPRQAIQQWMRVFNQEDRDDAFGGYHMAARPVHGGMALYRFMFPGWVEACPSHLPSENDPSALRSHFRLVAGHLDKPHFLKDTFLVLTSDCLFPELDTQELACENSPEGLKRIMAPHAPRNLLPGELPKFFIWAYDLNWRPPSAGSVAKTEDGKDDREIPSQVINNDELRNLGKKSNINKEYLPISKDDATDPICNCFGIFDRDVNTIEADEDGYEGRVKVNIHVLFSLFYYARADGYDMKDLWRKAQSMPNKTWSCKANEYDQTQPDALV